MENIICLIDLCDDEENYENKSVANSDLSANDAMCSFNDDEEENSRSISSCSNNSLTEQVIQIYHKI